MELLKINKLRCTEIILLGYAIRKYTIYPDFNLVLLTVEGDIFLPSLHALNTTVFVL